MHRQCNNWKHFNIRHEFQACHKITIVIWVTINLHLFGIDAIWYCWSKNWVIHLATTCWLWIVAANSSQNECYVECATSSISMSVVATWKLKSETNCTTIVSTINSWETTQKLVRQSNDIKSVFKVEMSSISVYLLYQVIYTC